MQKYTDSKLKIATLISLGLFVLAQLTLSASTGFADDSNLAIPEDAPFDTSIEGPLSEGEIKEAAPQLPPIRVQSLSSTGGTWVAQGPGPSRFGQVENVSPNNEVVGAIHTLAAHPTNANILYIGGVNGGIWKSTNATAASPNWTPQTDDRSSMSIGALEFDPNDATHNTLWAGIGRFSSFSSKGGLRTGLLKTSNGGTTWAEVDGGGLLNNKNVSGIAPRGNTIVVASNFGVPFTFPNIGIFRSNNGGTSFNQMSTGSGAATGLPGGVAHDLASNPNTPSVLYTSIIYADYVGGVNGVYRSTNTGATWSKVSSFLDMDPFLISGTTSNVEISLGNSGQVRVAILNSGQLRNGGVWHSPSGNLGTWSQIDTLLVNETGGNVGTNPRFKPDAGVPGGQGAIHFSILSDPSNANLFYVGGDRQPAGYNDQYGFPNAVGANDYSGRLFRGDSSVAPTMTVPSPQWKHLTHTANAAGMTGGGTSNNSSPHADSREMVFDANGNLIEVDDGGIYRRTSPQTNTGAWFSINGDLQVTEQHDVAYDTLSNRIISGNQDTGTTQQTAVGSKTWDSVSTADGGDVAVSIDPSNSSQSIRYSSNQYLGLFKKRTYNSSGALVATSSPTLNVISGASFGSQFVTPIEVNSVDANRLLFGGNNGLYESSDMGTNITQRTTISVNSFEGGNTMVYGGRRSGVDNPDLVFAATNGREISRRTPAGGLFSATIVANSGDSIRGVIADPEDWMYVFAIDSNQVYKSSDSGATWSDTSGDLPTAFTTLDLRSIEFVRKGTKRALVVGTNQGVYMAKGPSFNSWSKVGTSLPNAPVWDMVYDVADDLLIVGTLGRGAWTLAQASKYILGGNLGFLPAVLLPTILSQDQ